MTSVASCEDCMFWKRLGPHDGTCRRRAPRPSEEADLVAHWPMTASRERCGDGLRRDPQAPALVACGQCRFWHSGPNGGLDPQNRRDEPEEWWQAAGHCVRHAPGPSSEPGCRGFWRATHLKDTCAEGEFV